MTPKEYQAQYQVKNKEAIAARKKAKRLENIEEFREKDKKYYHSIEGRIKRKNYFKKWQKNNKDWIRQYDRAYLSEYRKVPQNRISSNLRGQVRSKIKKGQKASSTFRLTGCSIEFLMNHLESKFTKGMTWDNYGIGGWEIDHILPCSSFDLTIPENQLKCFHYTNLQPLWASDNRSKSSRIMCKPKAYSWSTSQFWTDVAAQEVHFCSILSVARLL